MNELYKQILNLYEIEEESITPISNSREMYTCRNGKSEYVLRVSNRISPEGQNAETLWVNFLHNNGVNVSNAIASVNNKLVEPVFIDDVSFSVVLFKKAIGKIPTEKDWNNKLFFKCGETIAKMHNLSEINNRSSDRIVINDWNIQDEYNTEKHIPEKFKKLRDKCDSIYKQINCLPQKDTTYGVIHSDICEGNFFINNGEITLIDFQDCEQHFFINDLAVFIYFAFYNSFNGDNLNDYIENLSKHLFLGYKKERHLDDYWIKQIPLFMKLREVLFLNQIYCYKDIEKLDDDEKIFLNMYRRNIEYDIPPIELDFDRLLKSL